MIFPTCVLARFVPVGADRRPVPDARCVVFTDEEPQPATTVFFWGARGGGGLRRKRLQCWNVCPLGATPAAQVSGENVLPLQRRKDTHDYCFQRMEDAFPLARITRDTCTKISHRIPLLAVAADP